MVKLKPIIDKSTIKRYKTSRKAKITVQVVGETLIESEYVPDEFVREAGCSGNVNDWDDETLALYIAYEARQSARVDEESVGHFLIGDWDIGEGSSSSWDIDVAWKSGGKK